MRVPIHTWQPVIESLYGPLLYNVLDDPSPPGFIWVEPKSKEELDELV